MVQVVVHVKPKTVGKIQQIPVCFHAGGGNQFVHMSGKLLLAHIDIRWESFGWYGGERVWIIELAGLNFCPNLLCTVSRPQTFRRSGHLAGVKTATFTA